jgi:hypothetical protein
MLLRARSFALQPIRHQMCAGRVTEEFLLREVAVTFADTLLHLADYACRLTGRGKPTKLKEPFSHQTALGWMQRAEVPH